MHLDWNRIISCFPNDLPVLQEKETPVYVMSNEREQMKCLDVLSRLPKFDNGIHVGVSGLQNYSMICATQAPAALIIDFNPAVRKMHLIAFGCILASNTKKEFLDSFFEQPQVKKWIENSNIHIPERSCIQKKNSRSVVWPNTETEFSYIKHLHQNRRIIFADVDCFDGTSIHKINNWMERNHIFCRTLYVSNISDDRWAHGEISEETGEWIEGESFSFDLHQEDGIVKLNNSISSIITEKTVVIWAPENLKWRQIVYQGEYYRKNQFIPVEEHKEREINAPTRSFFQKKSIQPSQDSQAHIVAYIIAIALVILVCRIY